MKTIFPNQLSIGDVIVFQSQDPLLQGNQVVVNVRSFNGFSSLYEVTLKNNMRILLSSKKQIGVITQGASK